MLKYVFEKTLLPEWALGIVLVLGFTVDGSLSLYSGGSMLVFIGGIVFFIYRNEVPWTRIPAMLVLAIGVTLLLLSNI